MLLMLPLNANLQHLHFHLKSRSQVLAGRPWAVAWLLRVPHLCGSCQALATGVQTAEWMLPKQSQYIQQIIKWRSSNVTAGKRGQCAEALASVHLLHPRPVYISQSRLCRAASGLRHRWEQPASAHWGSGCALLAPQRHGLQGFCVSCLAVK